MLRSAALVVLLSFVALAAGPNRRASLERALTTSASTPRAPDALQWSRDRAKLRVQANPKLASFELGLVPHALLLELAFDVPIWQLAESSAPFVRIVDQRQVIRRLRAEHQPLDAPTRV